MWLKEGHILMLWSDLTHELLSQAVHTLVGWSSFSVTIVLILVLT